MYMSLIRYALLEVTYRNVHKAHIKNFNMYVSV